ncbi:MAG: hypothetical protein H7837_07430 [Magnetococcus sp. MYC-9]
MDEESAVDPMNNLQQRVAAGHDVVTQQEHRIQQLEADVHELMETLRTLLESQKADRESFRKKLAEIEGLNGKVKDVVHAAAESGRMVTTLEKRMDTVKKDAFSGVVVSVIAFSFLVILSLFLR